MPIARFQMPDGRVARFEVPDGYSPEQALGEFETWVSTQQPAEPSVGEKLSKVPKELLGFAEAPLAMGTGIVASALGGLKGLGKLATGQGLDAAAKAVEETQGYQPRTGVGQAIVKGVVAPFELATEGWKQMGQAVAGDEGELVGGLVVPAIGAVAGYRPMVKGAQAGVDAVKDAAIRRASEKASKQIDWLRQESTQAKIQAAKDLQSMGGVANPAEVNPTLSNRAKATLANKDLLQQEAAKRNAPEFIRAIKQELGVAEDASLDMDTLNKVRSQAGEAANEIRRMGVLPDETGAVISQLETLRPNLNILGQRTGAAKANAAVDEAIGRVTDGMTANEVLDSISTLRRDARATYNRTDLKPKDRRVADTQMGIADTLEALIEQNVSDATLLNRYRAGRELQAKTYVVEDIFNPTTGILDIGGLARGAPSKAKLTGNLAKLRNVAENLPRSTAPLIPESGGGSASLSRTGVGGSAGAFIGAPMGASTSLGIAGTLGELMGARLLRNRLLTKGQSKLLPEVTEMSSPLPVPPAPTSNLPVPYVSRGTVNPPEGPNWVPGRGFGPDITPQAPLTSGMLGFTPSENLGVGRGGASFGGAEQNINLRRRMADIAARQAEAESIAAEAAAPRQPAGTGMLYELDPITGKLRAADQGVKGATIQVVEDAGKDLTSALAKLRGEGVQPPQVFEQFKRVKVGTNPDGSPKYVVRKIGEAEAYGVQSGKGFDLTINEKIALNKYRQRGMEEAESILKNVKEEIPEFRTLSDEAIRNKIADRQWAAEALDKYRREYAEWAKRSSDLRQAFSKMPKRMTEAEIRIQRANIVEANRKAEVARVQAELIKEARDKVVELEALQDALSGNRAGTQPFIGQGPKTRAAQRGMLFGEE